MENNVRNTDIVAAILAHAVVQKVASIHKPTQAGAINIHALSDEAVAIFEFIKNKIEKI